MAQAATKFPVRINDSAAVSIFGDGQAELPAGSAQHTSHVPATLDLVRRIVGDVDDATAIAILALHPTTADLEQAVLWAAGNGDVLGKQGHALTGVAAAIFDLLTADEDEP